MPLNKERPKTSGSPKMVLYRHFDYGAYFIVITI